jgi:nicotinamidase-related amidase
MVLDIQQKSYADEQEERSVKELIQTVNGLINKFDTQKVIYVRNTKKTLLLTLKGFTVDTIPVRKLDSSLSIVNSNIFTKYDGDAFTSEEIVEFLEQNKAKDIVIVGRVAEECIYKTAMGGKARGYNIYIITKAIIGNTKKKKEKAINKMLKKGIKQISVEEINNAP